MREGVEPENVAGYDDADAALEDVRAHARAGDVVLVKASRVAGLETARGGAAVISILVAAAVGLAVTLLGTPIAIRGFRILGWGQRIREDGPHTHMEKMGTPTMGGIVMLAGLVGGYLASRLTAQRFTVTGLALVLAAVGFGIVGFLDDYMKVSRRRSLGLTKAQKFVGTARGLDRVRHARHAGRRRGGHLARTCRSCAPPASPSGSCSTSGRSSC